MSLRSREPLFWVALAFAAGIAAGTWAWRPDPWWWAAFGVALGASAFFLKKRLWLALPLALAAVLCAGALESQIADRKAAPDISRWTDGSEVVVTGHVTRDSMTRPLKFGKERQSVEIEAEEIATGEDRKQVNAGVRVTIYGEDAGEPLLYGQRVRFPTRLREPVNYRNPGAWDAKGYLLDRGIVAMASVRADRVERLAGFGGSRLEDWRQRVRRGLMARTVQLWGAKDAPVLYAMLIGQQSYIDRDVRIDFQRTGTYHILVVSGMNVGILAVVVFWVLRRVRAGEVATTVVAVVTTCLYAVLTDAGPPIYRATLMLWIYLGARLLYRERAPLNAVGAAALGLLVADPKALFDPSFQLTFLSVAAIAGIGVPLLERTSQRYVKALRYLDSVTYDMTLPPRMAQFRLDLRMIAGRLSRVTGRRLARWSLTGVVRTVIGAVDLLVIAALMQAALALPMAVYFHRAAILALPANSIVVPLATILMPLAIVAVLLSYVWLGVAKVAIVATALVLHAISGVVRMLGGWTVADVRVATPSFGMMLACMLAFGIGTALIRRRAMIAAAGLAVLAASAAWVTMIPPREQVRAGVLEITSLDVGQGDSHFIVTPGGRKLLLDAGGSTGSDPRTSFDIGEEVVSPYLWSRGITRLDAVALSHSHADHMGGLASIIGNFRPRELWIGSAPDVKEMDQLLKFAKENGVSVILQREGERFEFGGATFEVLSPAADWDASEKARNDDSLVLRVAYGETSALLEGDAEKRVERKLAPTIEHADLLKVAHHGSATSSQPEFLTAVHPGFAIISAGRRNSFGYPKAVVLDRLQSAKVRTYRTDTEGAVTFYLDGKGVEATQPNRR